MKRIALCLVTLFTLFGAHPRRLAAGPAPDPCMWVWYASWEYYDLNTGEIIIVRYYKRVCFG